MVSDTTYYCRQKGKKEWNKFTEHPARSLEGVASLYAGSKKLEDGVLVQISYSPDEKNIEGEFKYKSQ